MDFYEILTLALAAAQLVIQIAQLLFQRRNKGNVRLVKARFAQGLDSAVLQIENNFQSAIKK